MALIVANRPYYNSDSRTVHGGRSDTTKDETTKKTIKVQDAIPLVVVGGYLHEPFRDEKSVSTVVAVELGLDYHVECAIAQPVFPGRSGISGT